jgi:hypothetical protein
VSIACSSCAQWVAPLADPGTALWRCPLCNAEHHYSPVPLFVLTGACGSGKSGIASELRPLLPELDVFDTDELWDSGGDWEMVRENWMRVARQVGLSGRSSVLCGVHLPAQIDACGSRWAFDPVRYALLTCAEDELARRLQARPAWRGCDGAFVQEQCALNRALRSAALPPGDHLRLCTEGDSPAESACRVASWIRAGNGGGRRGDC